MENYISPPEVSIHFYFCLQSLKCDTLPPRTFKLWQFNSCSLFIPKIPPLHFFFKSKNKKKLKKYAGGLGWFSHPQADRSGGGRTTPSGLWGWFGRPLGQTPKNEILSDWPKGWPNHPLGHWEWFGHPQTNWSRAAKPLPVAHEVVRLPLGPN
jgi:hypothetical protein